MWLHSQVAGTTTDWSWARLEEAVAYQYPYGSGNALAARAANFAVGMVKIKPFPSHNRATAFIAMTAFLALNGHALHIDDKEAAEFFTSLLDDPESAEAMVTVKLEPHLVHHSGKGFDTQSVAQEALVAFPGTVKTLAKAELKSAGA